VDDEGIRFWNAKPVNGEPLLRITWPAVTGIGYADAATIGGEFGDRLVVRARLEQDKLCDLPFQVLRYTQVVPASRTRRAQIAALLAATQKSATQPTR
ncbi:hypothetical protein, partial [Humibacter antri]